MFSHNPSKWKFFILTYVQKNKMYFSVNIPGNEADNKLQRSCNELHKGLIFSFCIVYDK